jgi:AraC-like DNA-binding protein
MTQALSDLTMGLTRRLARRPGLVDSAPMSRFMATAQLMDESVAAAFVKALMDLAVSKGADPSEMGRRAGIGGGDLDDPDRRLPLDRYRTLMQAAKEATGDPALALHFGEAFDITELSIVGLMGQASGTIGEAFAQLGRYTRLAVDVPLREEADGQRYVLKRADGELWLIDMRRDPNAFPELTESAFARRASGGRRAGGGFVKAVHFTHQEPPYRAEYDRIFGVPVVFGSHWNAFQLSGDEWMRQPTTQGSPYMFEVLKERAEALLEHMDSAATMRGRVETLIAPVLHNGGATMAAASAKLGISRATLGRRLRAEGTTFERVLDGLRRRLALEYLGERRLPVGETAYLLGFSEPAAFSRAFRRWTGQSPRSFQGELRSPP